MTKKPRLRALSGSIDDLSVEDIKEENRKGSIMHLCLTHLMT